MTSTLRRQQRTKLGPICITADIYLQLSATWIENPTTICIDSDATNDWLSTYLQSSDSTFWRANSKNTNGPIRALLAQLISMLRRVLCMYWDSDGENIIWTES